MTVLAIRDLTIRIAGRPLLENADLMVDPGRKIGLVGRNGAGKSTLLRAITGQLQADGGEIRLAARARMTHVAQEAPGGPTNLLDTVLAADTERASLMAELDTATDGARLAEIHERLIAIQADSAPSRAAIVLSGLGFDAAAQQRPVSEFSGGWRMRVALASALFLEPDILLLDEPTNHLDLEATIWLEGWLTRFSGAVLVVSHDRGLLERCVDAIAHLDQNKITLYPGAYDNFVRVRSERAAQQTAANVKVAAQRAHMQAFVDRFKAQASKARQAQSRIKALEKLPQIESVIEDHVTRFAFPEPAELPPPILALARADVGYADRTILSGLDLRLDQEDRIALLGANGNGKSTLAKLLAGRLEPSRGEVKRTPRLKVGYFAQHQTDELDLDGTPLSHMQAALGNKATETQCRSQLARFGLDVERAVTKISSLSGGEKGRLLLALCTREAPQLLILDEPTNHLDIDAREALVRALADYRGAVILITHDPHLVELAADKLWLVGEGKVTPFEGDLDDYRAYLSDRTRAARAANNGAKEKPRDDRKERAEARAASKAALAPVRERVAQIEADMARMGKEAEIIAKKLADPATHARFKPSDIAKVSQRHGFLTKQVKALEEEWLSLQERLEEAA
jgi:ATP-binding cassette subfamily F protein 3